MHESSSLREGLDRLDALGLDSLAEKTGLEWRPLHQEDLAEVSGLLTAIEHLDDPGDVHSLEQLEETYLGAHRPPPENAAIGRLPGGQVVAYVWNYLEPADVDPRRVFLTGGVHPGFRGRGIGRAALQWQRGRARAYDQQTRQPGFGPLQEICFVDEHLVSRRNLLAAAGFVAVRWSVDMSLSFGDRVDSVQWPADVDLVPYQPSFSEEVRECHNRCFAEQPMAQPVPSDSWQRSLARDSFHPEWSWCARDRETGVVIGYALNSGYEQDWNAQGSSEGWTDRLGVLPEWRGRGVAAALLQTSMASFRRAGLEGAGLGVDLFHESRGRGLYERVGYRPARATIMYRLSDS